MKGKLSRLFIKRSYKHRQGDQRRTRDLRRALSLLKGQLAQCECAQDILEQQNSALTSLNECAAELGSLMSSAAVRTAVVSSSLAPHAIESTAQHIEAIVWIQGSSPSDEALQPIRQFPLELITKLEQGFQENLLIAYNEYQVNLSARTHIVSLIENAIKVRRRISALLFTMHPELYCKLSAAAAASPATQKGREALHGVSAVMNKFQVSPEQRMRLQVAWANYCRSTSHIENEAAHFHDQLAVKDANDSEHHKKASTSSDASVENNGGLEAGIQGGMMGQSQDFERIISCVKGIRSLYMRRIAALGRLHVEVNASFTWLQFTELQLAAAPFAPDPMQVCGQLLEVVGENERRLQSSTQIGLEYPTQDASSQVT